MRRENPPHYEDENLNSRNRNFRDDNNYQRGMNYPERDQLVEENENPNRGGNFMNDFMNNPKEAIAKEIIGRAEENLSKSWSDKFKCNFE